ncbi:hypothetical protein ABT298_29045 [Streptomyces sp. NPDC001034]|uniref:hypothetical protein n=1 Tax=Streptomyces sp. NPDC001034 TaxID=3154375 RepID=UPI0033235EE7
MDRELAIPASTAATEVELPARDGREADEVRRVAGETRATDAGSGFHAGSVDIPARASGQGRACRAGRDRRADER